MGRSRFDLDLRSLADADAHVLLDGTLKSNESRVNSLADFSCKGLLKTRNYSRLMALLRRAKKVRVDGGEWNLIRVNPSVRDILCKLEPVQPEPAVRHG